MSLKIYTEYALTKRIKKHKGGITFVIGSAFSQKDNNGFGIPNVEGVIEFIEDYIKRDDPEDLDYFRDQLSAGTHQERYQMAFDIVSSIYGQDAVNEIIADVIKSNEDENGKQRIPKAVSDFVTAIKNKNINVTNIVTTNFDTLLEEEFQNQGIECNSYSLVNDTHFQSNVNSLVNVFHLHGKWDQDTMHTVNQLQVIRERIEISLQNLVKDDLVVVIAYGGWEDSFTRSLASVVTNPMLDYQILWTFYEPEETKIQLTRQGLFKELGDAITRARVHFYKGVDCNSTFEKLSEVNEVKKKRNAKHELDRQLLEELNFYDIENRGYNRKVRNKTYLDAIKHLNDHNALSILAPLGYGVYDFISSFKHDSEQHKSKFFRIDCSEVLTKAQIESQVKIDTYQALSQLILLCCAHAKDELYFVIFDNIKSSMSSEALNYLAGLPESLPIFGKNIFFIFTSSVSIKQFRRFHVELEALTLRETELILNDRIDLSEYTQSKVALIHDRSEGVVDKLEQIMDLVENSSVDEVLEHDEIFDDDFHLAHIPATTLSQLELLFTDASKKLTLKMLNILSILKNGETLTNLKADPMGRELNPKHVQELVRFELATTVKIDASTIVIKINPIIKDYVLSKMSKEQVYEISNAYLNVTMIPTTKGVRLSSLNRKVYQKGYSTEEDNTGTLLLNSIESCLDSMRINTEQGESNEMNERRLVKLRHYCSSYVYILRKSDRYAETISAVDLLHDTIKKIDPDSLYKYYISIASSYRMRSNFSEAKKYLDLCVNLCPESDKGTLDDIYIERLHLLEHTDIDAAIALAKSSKSQYHRKSIAYILSDVIIAEEKDLDDRFKSLVRLEKRARKQNHFTLANNILFTINNERSNVDKIKNLDIALESEKSSYNFCRATIYKHQALVESGLFERIKEQDIQDLSYIYNYLFRQKFDSLFVKCHKLLWDIAAHRQRGDIITMIYIRGTIVWRLNDDSENEQKYEKLIQDFDEPILVKSLVNKT